MSEDVATYGAAGAVAVVAGVEALRRWLAAHPVALVGALERTGLVLPWPHLQVPLGPGHHLETRSLLELVVDQDRAALTGAFLVAVDGGVPSVRVHLAERPDETVQVRYFDLRADLGLIVRACWRDDAPGDAGTGSQRVAAGRPRLALVTKGPNGEFTAVDGDFTRLLGWQAADVVGHRSLEIIHPDDQSRAVDNWIRMMATGGRHSVRLRHLHRDGSWVWLETCNDRADGSDGGGEVRCQFIDVSQEMEAAEALRHREQLLRRVTEAVPVGLAHVAADGSVTYANTPLLQLLGAQSVDHRDDLLAVASAPPGALSSALDAVLSTGDDSEVEIALAPTPDRPARRCRCTLSAIGADGAVSGVLLCIVDVTALADLARHDPLTGLLNRSSILSALGDSMARAGQPVGLAFVDLDRFKDVNDRHGHAAGDEVLRLAAAALGRAVRSGDLVGRIGGDEFLAVCPGVRAGRQLERIGSRIRAELDRCGAPGSVGLHVVIGGTTGPEEAVAGADRAMYDAKRRRRSPAAP